MRDQMTRRGVLKLGTSAAISAATSWIPPRCEKSATLNSGEFSNPSRLPGSEYELCFTSAAELAQLIRQKKVSARELMQACLKQIHRVNPKVNAIVTLLPEDQLMAQATAADEGTAKGNFRGPLHGIPVAVKDLHPTKGIRTTYGSPLHKEDVPEFDCLVVEREKNAGAILIGKTNVPEWGLGSQTFNPVFGPTRNPYDLTKTCGGSTGGGAVAVACGMVPLADGSDQGGSLRNPPNFCNIVGLRTSPGRVPNPPNGLGWFTLSVAGCVTRNVTDSAFFLSVLAGFDRRSPIAIDQPGSYFSRAIGSRNFKGTRVAMFKDLGLPWEPEVKTAVQAQRHVFESLGCTVEEAEPDFKDANESFLAWRHWNIEAGFADVLEEHPDGVNEYIRWHVEAGRKLTGPYLARMETKRTALYERMRAFMERYEFFVLPVNQVLPFDVNMHYPTEIAGVRMENYIAWMKSAYYISAVGNPAISVPGAFSASGLPIGVQIVGRHHDDWEVLQLAYAFEQATKIGNRRPNVA